MSKMPVDLSKVDLDQPAFVPEGTMENPTVQASQAESGIVTETPTLGGEVIPEPIVEEQKVPYSRLRETIEARRRAERERDEALQRVQEIDNRNSHRSYEPEPTPSSNNSDLPKWWTAMYGDDENSRNAFKYELQRQQYVKDEARKEALDAVRQEREQEGQTLSRNEGIIDNRLEDLSLNLGRDLSEQEESAILDIVDEYTPKDREGNYAGDLMSMEKAWEILNYRNSQAQSRGRQARQIPTMLTSTRSEGEPSGKAQNDKDFNPRDWNAYKKRLPR